MIYIVAGAFGQHGSTADRISRDEHRFIKLERDCRFVVSSTPGPPGSRVPMEALRNRLILAGAEVIYPKVYDKLHISGHGHRGDLETIASIAKPKYFIPIGGSVSEMRAYRNMAEDIGYSKDNVFELLEGDNVSFNKGKARLGKRLKTKQVLIDGTRIGEVGAVVIRDREQLSTDGVFVIVVPVSKKDKTVVGGAEIVTRGFIYVKESRQLMGKAKDRVNKIVDKYGGNTKDWNTLYAKIEKDVSKFLYKENW